MTSLLLFAGAQVFDGDRFLDGPRDVLVRDGRVAAVAPRVKAPAGADRQRGGVLFPGFVDAHVHLSFSDAASVVRGGVTAALDLGEPLGSAFSPHPPLKLRAAGPLLTAPSGYPTQSWGADGYGLEVPDAAGAREAVAMLADHGASIVKAAIEPAGGPLLPGETLRAVVEAAHARGLKVAAHALGVRPVRGALAAGVDMLAHTPTERLPDDLVRELGIRGVVVISTMRAFGAGRAARENLEALAAAGCPVAYGTDLGNGSIRPGIDAAELAIVEDALGDRERALAAATSGAAALAGTGGGRIAPGAAADLVWLPAFAGMRDLGGYKETWVDGEGPVPSS